jgi:RecG-like helicase
MHISLIDPIHEAFKLTKIQKVALNRLGIKTIKDLLYHFPVRYGDTAKVSQIEMLNKGDSAVIFGRLIGLNLKKAWKSHIPMTEGTARVMDFCGQGVKLRNNYADDNGPYTYVYVAFASEAAELSQWVYWRLREIVSPMWISLGECHPGHLKARRWQKKFLSLNVN